MGKPATQDAGAPARLDSIAQSGDVDCSKSKEFAQMNDTTICFRLTGAERAAINSFLTKFRKRTGTNYSTSELIRRCLSIGLRDHRAELGRPEVEA